MLFPVLPMVASEPSRCTRRPGAPGALRPCLAVIPANDNFADAESVSGAFGVTEGKYTLATAELNEPALLTDAPATALNSVWWRWRAPSDWNSTASRLFVVSTEGHEMDSLLEPHLDVFHGNSLATLTRISTSTTVAGQLCPRPPSYTSYAWSCVALQASSIVASQDYYFRVTGDSDELFRVYPWDDLYFALRWWTVAGA